MVIKYILTEKEQEFLKQLKSSDRYYKNSISGAMKDDEFRKEWKGEMREFQGNNLLNQVDVYEGYWRYELSEEGKRLQKQVIDGTYKI